MGAHYWLKAESIRASLGRVSTMTDQIERDYLAILRRGERRGGACPVAVRRTHTTTSVCGSSGAAGSPSSPFGYQQDVVRRSETQVPRAAHGDLRVRGQPERACCNGASSNHRWAVAGVVLALTQARHLETQFPMPALKSDLTTRIFAAAFHQQLFREEVPCRRKHRGIRSNSKSTTTTPTATPGTTLSAKISGKGMAESPYARNARSLTGKGANALW